MMNFNPFLSKDPSIVASKNFALRKSIIKRIDQTGHCTIIDLSKELTISIPKTTELINSLVEDGLVLEQGKLDSTGGRKANVYGLNAGACHFIGVAVNRFHIDFVVMDLNKNIQMPVQQKEYLFENTPDAMNNLIGEIKKFLESIQDNQLTIIGLGISFPGRTNSKIGRPLTLSGKPLTFFNFTDEPLSEVLQKEINIPVFIENDTRTMMFAETNLVERINEKNILFVNVDYGIGIGIIIDGKTYYGKSGYGGEIGHSPFFDNDITCTCGKKGCFETEASGFALKRKFKEKLIAGNATSSLQYKNIDDIKLPDILQAINNADMLAIELLAEVGEKLGKGLAVLINIFNPDSLILGGALAETGDYLRLPVKNALNKLTTPFVNNDTNLRLSKLGVHANVMGACLIARNRIIF
jgi:hypothetical protein